MNMEQLPNPRSTPITPETVANFDPKIQKILLDPNKGARTEHRPKQADLEKIPLTPSLLADAKEHATRIESTLPEKD